MSNVFSRKISTSFEIQVNLMFVDILTEKQVKNAYKEYNVLQCIHFGLASLFSLSVYIVFGSFTAVH